MSDPRRSSPAALRNRRPILEAIAPHLPASGLVLEVASGSGEHVVFLAGALPHLVFQPSDADAGAMPGIAAYVGEERRSNVLEPVQLDVEGAWPIERADVVLCINMLHIAPWSATPALMRGAASVLPAGGPLFLYGPFLRPDVETAPGNLAFDADLKRRDPRWGLRDLVEVAGEAEAAGFGAPHIAEMPANNLIVRFELLDKRPAALAR